jgi:hypothetical protein
MKTDPTPNTPRAAVVARWTARLLSLAVIGVILAFMIGEGFNPLHFGARDLALCAFFPLGLVVGLALAWRWELAGGLIAVLSILGFYALHLILSGGFPRGWAFPTLAVPGLLFLFTRLLVTSRTADAKTTMP